MESDVQWDASGLRGVCDRYEILIIPQGEGWAALIYVNKVCIEQMKPVESKSKAHERVEEYLHELDRTTLRLMDRMGFDDEDFDDED